MSKMSEFQSRGYSVATGILNEETVQHLVRKLDDLSRRRRGFGGWTVPDGVTQTPRFWPLIFNETMLATVRELIGPDIRFLQHNDLHVGFSSYNWHRDSVSRRLGERRDWDETEPYRIVRVGFYLQPRDKSPFRLGFLPGTHRLPSSAETRDRRRLERVMGNLSLFQRVVSGGNRSPATAEWLTPAAGDAVIFDPRIIHTGSRMKGHKYSVFLAYGVPNSHYFDHAVYYRYLRPDLGYQPIHSELVTRLRNAGLYQQVESTGWRVQAPTVPGFMQCLIARYVRHRIRENEPPVTTRTRDS